MFGQNPMDQAPVVQNIFRHLPIGAVFSLVPTCKMWRAVAYGLPADTFSLSLSEGKIRHNIDIDYNVDWDGDSWEVTARNSPIIGKFVKHVADAGYMDVSPFPPLLCPNLQSFTFTDEDVSPEMQPFYVAHANQVRHIEFHMWNDQLDFLGGMVLPNVQVLTMICNDANINYTRYPNVKGLIWYSHPDDEDQIANVSPEIKVLSFLTPFYVDGINVFSLPQMSLGHVKVLAIEPDDFMRENIQPLHDALDAASELETLILVNWRLPEIAIPAHVEVIEKEKFGLQDVLIEIEKY